MTTDPLVKVEDLSYQYRSHHGFGGSTVIQAIDHLSLDIHQGEMLGIVGESGSGKSTLGRSLVRLLSPTEGRILFGGADVAALKGNALMKFRGDSQIVFQNPYQSLNPRMTLESALGEVISVWGPHREGVSSQTVAGLLDSVHLPASYAQKYPHELSGGERQRVAIARAMAVKPRFLVADEPVSALDVSAAARVLNLLIELREQTAFTCAFITHDIALARIIADRLAVMYRGKLVDLGPPDQVFTNPSDEYTKALIAAQLKIPTSAEEAASAPG